MSARSPATRAEQISQASLRSWALMGPWPAVLVALTLTLVLEAARVMFPILFDFAEETGRFVLGGGLVALVFLAPLLTPLLLRLLGLRRAFVAGIALLAALRLLVQVVHPIPFGLAAATTLVGLVVVTIEVVALMCSGDAGRRSLVAGLLLGLAVDLTLRGAFLGWDHAWQSGNVPLLVTAVLGGAATLVAVVVFPLLPGDGLASARLVAVFAIGPFLLLHVLFLQNLGFVASASGVSMAGATALVLIGDALGLLAAGSLRMRRAPGLVGLASAAAFVAATVLLRRTSGVAAAILLLIGHALAAGLLARAHARSPEGPVRPAWPVAAAFGAGTLVLAVLLVAYQIHYAVPLPVPNMVAPGLAAVLLGLAGWEGAGGGSHERETSGLAVVPVILLLVPGAVHLTAPAVSGAPSAPVFRLVDFNVRLAVNVHGQVDPEGTARAIEGEQPDVVVLQEVGRGWPVNGTLDVAEWLSRRLGMPYVFAPAADGQFGNAVFSRFPILETDSGFLPFGAGPQRRGYIAARLDVGRGQTVRVVSVHLQNAEGTTTRRDQIRALLAAVGEGPRTIIAGDLNAQPGDADLEAFSRAGFVSVQDEAGLGHVSTASQPKVHPVDRVNWVFATPDLVFSDVTVVPGEASDHLPIAATVKA